MLAGKTLHEQKDIVRPNAQHDERASIKPVFQSFPFRQRQILFDRESGHVSYPSPAQIARRGVMDSVLSRPLKIRRVSENTANRPDEVVRFWRLEERPVPA